MEIRDRTVLITGGGSGIGKGLAEVFYRFGSQVIVTGRKEEPLKKLCDTHPGMHWFVMDVTDPESVRAAVTRAEAEFPTLDCLINNAGIQKRYDLTQEPLPELETLTREVDTNLKGLIWMSTAFLPLLRRNAPGAIINISSGLSFVPIAQLPVYCATKAAVHSFTQSLRHQLRGSDIHVVELMPPAVESNLVEHSEPRILPEGADELSVASFVDATLQALLANEEEIAIGTADQLRQGAQHNPEQFFGRINA